MSEMGEIGRQLLGIAISGACVLGASCATAQITPDRTLPNNSNVTINGSIFNITGGTQAGQNLFHSFQQFSVPANNTALFNNGLDIQNIFSRVTGGSVSNINGLIRANGAANLFLINPSGIVFVKGASLNIGGSFLASTASSLKFADGTEFSAKTPSFTPLLTISVPTGLQYGSHPGDILNQSQVTNSSGGTVGLQVQLGKTLALVGGNVSLDGGILQASGGRVELGGLAGAGTVGLNVDGNLLSLSFPNGVALADVFLSNAASVYASGEGGGNIQVQGRRILLTEGSGIIADTIGSENGDGIFLRASQLIVRDGSFISSRTFGTGQGGNLTVSASDSVELIGTTPDGKSPSVLFTRTEDAGSAGKLTIETGQLIVRDGAQVVAGAGVRSTGQGGNLQVTASDSVELSGRSIDGQINSGLYSQTEGVGTAGDLTITTGKLIVQNQANISTGSLNDSSGGAAGNLTIATGKLIVQNGSSVSTDTDNEGQGGNLTVTASDSVEVIGTTPDGREPSNLSSRGATGAGGNLTLETRRLIIRDGAQVGTGTFGKGNGGTLTVNASDSVELVGSSTSPDALLPSGLFTQTQDAGSAGDLKIDTKQLVVQDGARVSAGTVSQGNAGNIQIHATNSVDLSGVSPKGFSGGLFASTTGVGQGGNITVNSSTFRVADGAVVNAITTAQGNGGNITVNAKTFEADNGGQVITTTRSTGRSGNINLNVTDSVTLVGSDLTFANRLARFGRPRVSNEGSASGVFANTDTNSTGQGGKVTINTPALRVQDGAKVSVSSPSGQAGNLTVTARDIRLDRGSLTAETAITRGEEGANIKLQGLDFLLLQNDSLISARATGDARGGNIIIDADAIRGFVVAPPFQNSDIIANATFGNGGIITINARQIFGFTEGRAISGNRTNDIDASSQFNQPGTVQINTPEVDPSYGLVTLPTIAEIAPKLVDSSCANFNETASGSQFTVTGRGGLPSNPSEPLTSDVVWSDTRLPVTTTQHQRKTHAAKPKPQPIAIIPATGWVLNDKGEVTLISSVTNATTLNTPTSCPVR